MDREQKDFYDLKIVAKDNGRMQLSSSTQLKINVIDANDNSPVFYPKEYFVSIPTSLPSVRLPLETPLVSLQASDADADLNSKIEYNWDTSNALTQNHLRLNTDTGEIFPRRSFSISYENILNEYDGITTLKVYATDGGGRRSSESATIYLYSNKGQSEDGNNQVFQEKSLSFSIVEDNGFTGDSLEIARSRPGIYETFVFKFNMLD